MNIQIEKLLNKQALSSGEAFEVMNDLMKGTYKPEHIGAILGALRVKGETESEIEGCARALQSHAVSIPVRRTDLVDTCGTGGDGANTFNISTTTAFIIAASGLGVCKHGNRSVSSNCGSADVLEELGIKVDLVPSTVGQMVDEIGFGFLYAPKFHPAMKHVSGVRKSIGVKTIFNLLGPLVNPARVKRQVIGVFDKSKIMTVANVLNSLGSEEVMVVSGDDGLDEISTTTTTQVAHLKNGTVTTYEIDPRKYGIKLSKMKDLEGGSKVENARILQGILTGSIKGAKRDIVLLNSAAALLVGEKVSTFENGIKLAEDLIDSGKAYKVLNQARGVGHV